jgi:hypothetical protein
VFIVDLTANKRQIKDAVKQLYDIQPYRVNTVGGSIALTLKALGGDESVTDVTCVVIIVWMAADPAGRAEEGLRAVGTGLGRARRGQQDRHHLKHRSSLLPGPG